MGVDLKNAFRLSFVTGETDLQMPPAPEILARLKGMSDDELLRSSTSLDLFAVVESNRRLKVALHKEERAIKWLTGVPVILTVILVLLGVEALRQ